MKETNDLQNRNLHIKSIQPKSNDGSKESMVLALIKANPRITSAQLSKEINVSIRTIKSVLKALENNKKIKRINGKRYGYWKLL